MKSTPFWRNAPLAMVLTVVFGSLVSVVIGADGEPTYSPKQLEYYLEPNDLAYIRPGLQIEIQNVEIDGDTVTATIRLTDDKGVALDAEGILTPGPVSLNFVFARIKKGERQYTAYTTALRESHSTGEPLLQASRDTGGTLTAIGDGVYTYTFGTKLPSDYDPTVTHTLGIYATRDLREFGLEREASSAVFDFVPSGEPVTVVRDVVRTENCNTCHDPLVHHHGARKGTRLCVLCHTPQSTDNVSGRTVDFKVLIHKVHRGANLPSVQAGIPFGPIGHHFADFSEVEFPQDIRNCTVCHRNGTQSDNYMLKPSRAACGACHDEVDFTTGENHGSGGVQLDDNQCTVCHAPETGREFDISVKGAHTVPWKSKQLAGLNPEILSVDGAVPGGSPTVVFKITDDSGAMVDPSTLDRVRLGLGGPTNDSVFGLREDARQATPVSGGYSHQFEAVIPEDASGTWVVGTEIFRNLTLNKINGGTVSVREAPNNELFFIPITGSEPVRRRSIVSGEKCNVCHDRLALHGASRQNVEYCPTCHRPGATDEDHRPAEELPAETLDFKNMIHKIHTGHDLANEFTIFDEGEPEGQFNEVHFPGDRRNCSKCHEGTSYQLPLPEGLQATITPRGYFSPTPPASTACLACHDTISAAAHAFMNIAPFGEGCAACHGEGREFAVTRVHAR